MMMTAGMMVMVVMVLPVRTEMAHLTLMEGQDLRLACHFRVNNTLGSSLRWEYKATDILGKAETIVFCNDELNPPCYVQQSFSRVEFSGDLKRGNGSITIKRVTLNDSGVYSCTVNHEKDFYKTRVEILYTTSTASAVTAFLTTVNHRVTTREESHTHSIYHYILSTCIAGIIISIVAVVLIAWLRWRRRRRRDGAPTSVTDIYGDSRGASLPSLHESPGWATEIGELQLYDEIIYTTVHDMESGTQELDELMLNSITPYATTLYLDGCSPACSIMLTEG